MPVPMLLPNGLVTFERRKKGYENFPVILTTLNLFVFYKNFALPLTEIIR